MGKKDIVTKEFMADSRVFADAFNYLIYGGEQVIVPDRLQPLDTTLTAVPYGAEGTEAPVQRFRDELKYLNSMEDGSAVYLLLGIENQGDVNYAMPVKDMVYDALQYAAQVERTARHHRMEKHRRSGMDSEPGKSARLNAGEYLTGFYRDDRLIPVITLVVFFSAEKWDGPKSIHDMLSVTDPRILSLVPDYRINLIAPEEMEDKDFDRLRTNLREVLLFIRNSKDNEKLKALVMEDERFRSVEKSAVRVMNTVTGSRFAFGEKEEVGSVDMCKAIYDMREEARTVGREEGREEGRIEDILILLGELQGKVSGELRELIMSEKDAETLKRYLKLAASADSVEEFVSRMA